jgi:hypothetical protein
MQKRTLWLASSMLVVPVVSGAAFVLATERPTRSSAPPAPSSTLPRAARATAKPVEEAIVHRSTPRATIAQPPAKAPNPIMGSGFDALVPSSAQALEEKWKNDLPGTTAAALRTEEIQDVFRDEGVPNALREVECRAALCKVTLDVVALTEWGKGAAAAERLGANVTILEASAERMTAMIPVEPDEGFY